MTGADPGPTLVGGAKLRCGPLLGEWGQKLLYVDPLVHGISRNIFPRLNPTTFSITTIYMIKILLTAVVFYNTQNMYVSQKENSDIIIIQASVRV